MPQYILTTYDNKNKGNIKKKITLAVLMIFSFSSIASADLGIKIGVSAQFGEMSTTASEKNRTQNTTESKNIAAVLATGSGFIEKDLKFIPIPIINRISLGYDSIGHDINLGTQNNVRKSDLRGVDENTIVNGNHALEAKITGFKTQYATLNIFPWLYVKGGTVEVEVKTKFTGTPTSKYKDTHSLDGTMYGIGFERQTDQGFFLRGEYNDYDIDGVSVKATGTDSVFTATLASVSGDTAKISIGKAF